jgi:hypothetical protein
MDATSSTPASTTSSNYPQRRGPDDFAADMAARRQQQQQEEHGLDAPTHSPDEIITRARQAADRLTSAHAWNDWVAIGRALAIGKTEAMREAHTNKPEGRLYAAAFARWLSRVGLERVAGDKGTRSHLLDLIEHLDAVEAWRKTLPVNRQLQLNHPRAVRDQWRRATVVHNPNQQTRTSPIAQRDATIARLEEENHRLTQANGGNIFTRKDSARDVARVLRSMFSESKLAEIRRLLGKGADE